MCVGAGQLPERVSDLAAMADPTASVTDAVSTAPYLSLSGRHLEASSLSLTGRTSPALPREAARRYLKVRRR